MNHSLIKYLLLILCSISHECVFARIFNEQPFIEDPSQVELCFDDIYSFQTSPISSSYDQKIRVYAISNGSEDDFEDGAGDENPCAFVDGNLDCPPPVPVGNVFPLYLFIMLYGLWKWRRIKKIRR